MMINENVSDSADATQQHMVASDPGVHPVDRWWARRRRAHTLTHSPQIKMIFR